MSLFKKKKGNLEEQGFAGRKHDYFNLMVERKKVKIAGWLNQKTGGWPGGQKKIALIIFCLLFGAMSVYILAGSFRGHNFGNRNLVITHLRSGVHSPPGKVIPDSVYERAERTRLWLDSLKQNDTARFRVILLSRPLLLNNLQLIESIYHSQFIPKWKQEFIHPGF
jgi:hypothetical protein